VNLTLQFIDLSCNRIGNGGANSFAEALKINSTLQEIDLSQNKIGAEGAKLVAKALRFNSTLQKIGLGERIITDKLANITFQIHEKLKTKYCEKKVKSPKIHLRVY
jgi:Ran GTPase-activating protein (RanGAP) involved in mRNA processing and transport